MKYEEMMEITSNAVIGLVDNLEEGFDNLSDAEEGEAFSPHFSTFVDMIRCLMSRGWTVEELVKEVQEHGADQIEYNQQKDQEPETN